jgi:2-succinyl-5-enolpyruvyl-6-hydroxy-3-cyclohexene-1-carboxylate synthase
MNELVNNNLLWAELLVTALETYGIKYACLSPGSRNTPLVLAFQKSKKIKSFVHVDERSSGFFAIGLVYQTKSPVVIVTTSGTAVTELYPAVVEAYYKHIPLLLLTADRPQSMHNIGANQTINQVNIFKNHVRGYYEAGMPKINKPSLFGFSKKISSAVADSISKKGPIQFNFPFAKPFEPSAGTDDVSPSFVESMHREFSKNSLHIYYKNKKNNDIQYLVDLLQGSSKIMIILGNSKYKENIIDELLKLSKTLNAPIFADGFSNIRFLKKDNKNIITNFSSFFKSESVRKSINPRLIIQFGDTPVSTALLQFFKESEANKILVHKFGETQDPSGTAGKVISGKTDWICRVLNNTLEVKPKEEQIEFLNSCIKLDEASSEIKDLFLESTSFPFEGKIINDLLSELTDESNVMVSNSLPARDFDYFAEYNNHVKIFSNRGASGIDGIISTAAGMAAQSEKTSVLFIGDLAFYHDISGLLALKKYEIPLIIILFNNDGGAIFETLPIGKEKDIQFEEYFKTPIGLDYKSIVKGFSGNYKLISSSASLMKEFKSAKKKKTFSVLEIKIDSKTSENEREKFWTVLKAQVEADNGNIE